MFFLAIKRWAPIASYKLYATKAKKNTRKNTNTDQLRKSQHLPFKHRPNYFLFVFCENRFGTLDFLKQMFNNSKTAQFIAIIQLQ